MAEPLHDLLPLHAQALLAVERLVAGLQVGDRLPSERELSRLLGVSREPVRRAVQKLKDDGVLEVRHGSGARVARRLRTRTGLLGMAVPTIEWPTIARVVTGAEAAARAAGYHLVLINDQGRPELQQAQIASLLDLQVDGVLIFPDRENPTRTAFAELMRQFAARRISVVMIDRGVPGVDLPCVATDVAKGLEDATAHVLAAGCRRLGLLTWGDEAGTAEWNRWAGFRAALAAHGLPPQPARHAAVGYAGDACQRARELVAEWIRADGGRPALDAIVCFSDDFALGAFFALRDAGLTVPGACLLTGFDDTFPDLYQAHGLHLTTVAQPAADLGRVAVERLMDAIRSVEGAATGILLPPRLVVRSSTARTI